MRRSPRPTGTPGTPAAGDPRVLWGQRDPRAVVDPQAVAGADPWPRRWWDWSVLGTVGLSSPSPRRGAAAGPPPPPAPCRLPHSRRPAGGPSAAPWVGGRYRGGGPYPPPGSGAGGARRPRAVSGSPPVPSGAQRRPRSITSTVATSATSAEAVMGAGTPRGPGARTGGAGGVTGPGDTMAAGQHPVGGRFPGSRGGGSGWVTPGEAVQGTGGLCRAEPG